MYLLNENGQRAVSHPGNLGGHTKSGDSTFLWTMRKDWTLDKNSHEQLT